MKKLILITTLILTGILFAQSIDETLQQIDALKQEIAQNEKLVEEKISDMKRTNPLFAEQDIFESDAEYLGRMSRAMPQFDRLRKQYLDDLWQKMSILRGACSRLAILQSPWVKCTMPITRPGLL